VHCKILPDKASAEKGLVSLPLAAFQLACGKSGLADGSLRLSQGLEEVLSGEASTAHFRDFSRGETGALCVVVTFWAGCLLVSEPQLQVSS
jgi:hypothetical protein